jgi:hypothetical protein
VSHKHRSYAISVESNNIEEIVHLESQAKQLVETLSTQSLDSNFASGHHTLKQGLLMQNLPIINVTRFYTQSTNEKNFAKGWVKDIALETFFESVNEFQRKYPSTVERVLSEINDETMSHSLIPSQSHDEITTYITQFLSVIGEEST